jgi:hypothetical protein
VHIGTVAQVVYNFATSGAVIVGGIWAYFKFLRGRTFSRRAELSVTPSINESAGLLYLSVTIKIKNTGLSKLTLNEDMKYLHLYGMQHSGITTPVVAEWQRLIIAKIFDQHRFVEAQEEVADTIALRLPRSSDHHAYKVEAWLGSPLKKITGKGNLWQARSIIFASSNSPEEEAHSISNGNRKMIGRILDWRESK